MEKLKIKEAKKLCHKYPEIYTFVLVRGKHYLAQVAVFTNSVIQLICIAELEL